MTVKLTLSINEEIVKKAKRISKFRGKSISKIVEEYISSLPEKEPQKMPLFVKSVTCLKKILLFLKTSIIKNL